MPGDGEEEKPFLNIITPLTHTTRGRRRSLFAACASLSAVSLAALFVYTFWTFQATSTHVWNHEGTSQNLADVCANYPGPHSTGAPSPGEHSQNLDGESVEWEDDPLYARNYVLGEPTESYKDNLREDIQYITSWTGAGWTNDVMTFANLVYMGLITDRVPIIPDFMPSHIGYDQAPIPFGDVFDVPRFSKSLEIPILEWRDVKNRDSEFVDELGCWSVWQAVQSGESNPRDSGNPGFIRTDISYTRGPDWLKLIPNFEHDQHTTFWSLATLSYPQVRAANLVEPLPSPQHGVQLPPDEQLFCYDYGYYLTAHQPWEWEYDYSPAWNKVTQYMRWTEGLLKIADEHIRRALGVADGEPTPNWIALHVRHHDFKVYCGDYSEEDCFASLAVYDRRVQEVKQELLERKNITVEHVLMTSDEDDAAWWHDVEAMGWKHIDFAAERTEEIYGKWYPVLIDAVIQSMAHGFVGTDRSTMSMLARRRVEAWQEGATRTVKWGSPGADDH
ncbi:hypothetical protein PLICRDRAFT_36319 [Plicaturopsis crispa FD-325 SS-3]|nr:hypothetical protein PLICRDRAFT_36319 [Plicaturopsis crispa FD-325 SS-3]